MNKATTQGPHVLFLQLNELNFPFVDHYCRLGKLPNFKEFFDRHGYIETISESEHHLANPWIQWPTVHTGLDYSNHGVFRLGDIMKTDHPMIYDVLESHGIKVAALGAFNARNSVSDAAFFIPDPWTDTKVSGPKSLTMINDAVRQVTDDYARNFIAPMSLAKLALGGAVNMRWRDLPEYLGETARFASGRKWMRAVVADRLLGDAFLTQCSRLMPQFATLFVNGGAHLQHHYMYSSAAYEGPRRNPDWIVPEGEDPLLEVLEVYDALLGRAVRLADSLPDGRVLLATGLHQEPHERETYYYRLDDQVAFLQAMGISFEDSYRLMTEDFVVSFADEDQAARTEKMILDIRTEGIEPIFYVETGDSATRTERTDTQMFHVENRGSDLYVQLRPMSKAMPKGASARRGNKHRILNIDQLVSFAQYKNTHHHGVGYFADSGTAKGELAEGMPLREIFQYILSIYGVSKAPSVNQKRVDQALAG